MTIIENLLPDSDMMEDSTNEGDANITAKVKTVLDTLSSIRQSPHLRQSFISGNRDVSVSMNEVQNSFRSKKTLRKRAMKKSIQVANKGKRKKKYFKHIIACFSGPETSVNPTRQEWCYLTSIGLGKAWEGHVPSPVPFDLPPKEFHALLLSIFPALQSTSYELCKLGGAYNNEVTVLTQEGSSTDSTIFTPFWSPDALRSVIGKTAQLLIRPLCNISKKAKELKLVKVTIM